MLRAEQLDEYLRRLNLCRSESPNRDGQPVFLFLCGGEDTNPDYVCRKVTESFIQRSSELKGVVTVKPEILLNDYHHLIQGMNLLELETVIAELSDAILLFDESPGSVCELGAFAMTKVTREMMTVCVPSSYRGSRSFIIQGPVNHVASCNKPLSSVIYLDTQYPMYSKELVNYLFELKPKAQKQHNRKINTNNSKVNIGSFCRECLDLITIFAPVQDNELLDIYRRFKGFDHFPFSMASPEPVPRAFSYRIVFAYLASTGLIRYDKDGMIFMTGKAPGYFMFRSSKREEIQKIRAEILSAKRKGHEAWNDVCT